MSGGGVLACSPPPLPSRHRTLHRTAPPSHPTTTHPPQPLPTPTPPHPTLTPQPLNPYPSRPSHLNPTSSENLSSRKLLIPQDPTPKTAAKTATRRGRTESSRSFTRCRRPSWCLCRCSSTTTRPSRTRSGTMRGAKWRTRGRANTRAGTTRADPDNKNFHPPSSSPATTHHPPAPLLAQPTAAR